MLFLIDIPHFKVEDLNVECAMWNEAHCQIKNAPNGLHFCIKWQKLSCFHRISHEFMTFDNLTLGTVTNNSIKWQEQKQNKDTGLVQHEFGMRLCQNFC